MMSNCSCLDKDQDYEWNEDLGCWCVYRECDTCDYYFEEPLYTFNDPNKRPE